MSCCSVSGVLQQLCVIWLFVANSNVMIPPRAQMVPPGRRKVMTNEDCLQELTEQRVSQRMKQITCGKNTLGYERYRSAVQKANRLHSEKDHWHPVTPDIRAKCSARKFAAELRHWRHKLHKWGNLTEAEFRTRLPEESGGNDTDGDEDAGQGSLFSNAASLPNLTHEENLILSGSVSVTPVYRETELLAFFKSDTILREAKKYSQLSVELAQHLVDGTIPQAHDDTMEQAQHLVDGTIPQAHDDTMEQAQHLVDGTIPQAHDDTMEQAQHLVDGTIPQATKCDARYWDILSQSLNSSRIQGARFPVAFLGRDYRSMTFWPKCAFVREEDFAAASIASGKRLEDIAEAAAIREILSATKITRQEHHHSTNNDDDDDPLQLRGMMRRYYPAMKSLEKHAGQCSSDDGTQSGGNWRRVGSHTAEHRQEAASGPEAILTVAEARQLLGGLSLTDYTRRKLRSGGGCATQPRPQNKKDSPAAATADENSNSSILLSDREVPFVKDPPTSLQEEESVFRSTMANGWEQYSSVITLQMATRRRQRKRRPPQQHNHMTPTKHTRF